MVHEFQFTTAPDGLPAALSRYALHIAGFLTEASRLPTGELRQPRGRNEINQLLNQVLADLYRFHRLSPIDHSQRSFRVPGIQPILDERQRELRTVVHADSTLGKHLLHKSIDRLESLLFIQPDHSVAEYALGYCYAFHIDGIWNPNRAAVLLRRVFDSDPEAELGASALQYLSEISYHHGRGRLDPQQAKKAADQVRFAFEHMPQKHRTYQWARRLGLLNTLYGKQKDFESMANMMDVVLAMIDQVDEPSAKRQLTMTVGGMAATLSRVGERLSPRQVAARKLLMTWAKSDDKIQHHTGSLGLAQIARAEKDHIAAASWYQEAAASYESSAVSPDRYARENLLMQAARELRLADKPSDALRLLRSYRPTSPQNSLNRGYRDVEIGICLALLGKKEIALELWMTAAEEVPTLVNNTDVVTRIAALGGAPLRDDRDIDVRYVRPSANKLAACTALATDGSRLFCNTGFRGKEVLSYDINIDTWMTINQDIGPATCLAYADGALWVGTQADGLWRCHLVGNTWQQWSGEQGLPDQQVASLAVYGQTAYVGVGTAASGGLVRVDAKDRVHIFESSGAPRGAPTHLIVSEDVILARTLTAVYQSNTNGETWKRLPKGRASWTPSIHQGESTIWASQYGHELYKFDKTGKINDDFNQTWFPRGQGRAGYLVNFVAERDGQIWFGGTPWNRFKSSGFYRFDQRTGDFFMYGPRDGFKTSTTYTTYDGVWAADRLWLATSGGLAEVTPRKSVGVQSSRK